MSQEHFQTSVTQCSYLPTHAEKGRVWTQVLWCPRTGQSIGSCRRQTHVTARSRVNYSCGAVIYMCCLITHTQEKTQVQIGAAERNRGGETESLCCLRQVLPLLWALHVQTLSCICTMSFTIASVTKRDSLTCRELHGASWAKIHPWRAVCNSP